LCQIAHTTHTNQNKEISRGEKTSAIRRMNRIIATPPLKWHVTGVSGPAAYDAADIAAVLGAGAVLARGYTLFGEGAA
jgi:hypothetical protein